MLVSPVQYFAMLPDPRRKTPNKLHKLEDIIFITLCAILCGIEDWVGMEDFACENEEWLRQHIALPNGVPSHDTLSDVIGRINHRAFADAFSAWMREALPRLVGQQVALDGKTLRGSRSAEHGPVHLMSAFATQARLVLAAEPFTDKTNEITAIPALLRQLELRGAVVTIDAIGCQKAVAQSIVRAGAEYVLALKENHPVLHENVSLWLNDPVVQRTAQVVESVEKDHGRIETRRALVSTHLDWLSARADWPGLRAVAMVEATRTTITTAENCTERRYYLSSLTQADQIASAIRQHWRIENQQHWILDVQFGEDAHRTRKNHSAANLGFVRRAALNLLRQDQNNKLSIRRRKMRALSNLPYRQQILCGSPDT